MIIINFSYTITMLTANDLRKGSRILINGDPYEVIEARPLKMAQRRVVWQTKAKNLLNGNFFSQNFQQSDTFEEVEITKVDVKFLYSHHDRFFFVEKEDPSKRFDFGIEQLGNAAQFLKPGQFIDGIVFASKVINIVLPIKVQLKITEAPPGVKGERAQAGTKQVTLETGAKVNVPLFIEEGDIIEINTETGEYVKRAE
jgi:elongation factor P